MVWIVPDIIYQHIPRLFFDRDFSVAFGTFVYFSYNEFELVFELLCGIEAISVEVYHHILLLDI